MRLTNTLRRITYCITTKQTFTFFFNRYLTTINLETTYVNIQVFIPLTLSSPLSSPLSSLLYLLSFIFSPLSSLLYLLLSLHIHYLLIYLFRLMKVLVVMQNLYMTILMGQHGILSLFFFSPHNYFFIYLFLGVFLP
jgi:hypothetical protein